ncbi:MAG: hypothetical protein BWY70_00410 [Bacteroidetes bacterium ADurb.Bin408]|nr:MAG: hypothetical protein BWY70_00410 [Bacteroidetes bacterium ADurb.Bin408]
MIFFFILVFIEFFQSVYFQNFKASTLIGIILRLILGYIIIKIVKTKFLNIFINIIYFTCFITVPIFLIILLTPSIDFFLSLADYFKTPSFFDNAIDDRIYPNIIFYTFNKYFIYENIRNSGPFCEPGMYAVYLNLALLFNIMINKKMFSRKNIFLIVTIITTISTAGYLALFFILISNAMKFNKIKYYFIFIIMVSFSYYLFESLPFLKEKIETNIEDRNETTSSRFGSFMADLVLIKENPVIGYGRNVYDVIGVVEYDIKTRHRNNGVSKIIVYYGIIFVIYYFYLFYRTFGKIVTYYESDYKPFFCLLIVLILGFSQIIFQFPFFLSFPFLEYVYKKNRIINNLN